jgi:hypothetical protein
MTVNQARGTAPKAGQAPWPWPLPLRTRTAATPADVGWAAVAAGAMVIPLTSAALTAVASATADIVPFTGLPPVESPWATLAHSLVYSGATGEARGKGPRSGRFRHDQERTSAAFAECVVNQALPRGHEWPGMGRGQDPSGSFAMAVRGFLLWPVGG